LSTVPMALRRGLGTTNVLILLLCGVIEGAWARDGVDGTRVLGSPAARHPVGTRPDATKKVALAREEVEFASELELLDESRIPKYVGPGPSVSEAAISATHEAMQAGEHLVHMANDILRQAIARADDLMKPAIDVLAKSKNNTTSITENAQKDSDGAKEEKQSQEDGEKATEPDSNLRAAT